MLWRYAQRQQQQEEEAEEEGDEKVRHRACVFYQVLETVRLCSLSENEVYGRFCYVSCCVIACSECVTISC